MSKAAEPRKFFVVRDRVLGRCEGPPPGLLGLLSGSLHALPILTPRDCITPDPAAPRAGPPGALDSEEPKEAGGARPPARASSPRRSRCLQRPPGLRSSDLP